MMIGMAGARLTVTRTSPEDVRQRQIELSLDGHRWATLLYGQSASVELEPGPHTLRLHNTLVWKTLELTLEPGAHERLRVANRTGWGTWWMLSLLGVGPLYLSVSRDRDERPTSVP